MNRIVYKKYEYFIDLLVFLNKWINKFYNKNRIYKLKIYSKWYYKSENNDIDYNYIWLYNGVFKEMREIESAINEKICEIYYNYDMDLLMFDVFYLEIIEFNTKENKDFKGKLCSKKKESLNINIEIFDVNKEKKENVFYILYKKMEKKYKEKKDFIICILIILLIILIVTRYV